MPRPRRPFSGQETIELRGADWYEDDVREDVPGTRQAQRWRASRAWLVKPTNGFDSSLSQMFVVDALLRIDPSIELRAGILADWMTHHYPMRFDGVTLGRMLSDLFDYMGHLPQEQRYLNQGRDWKGMFYVIQPLTPSVRLMRQVRETLYQMAESETAVLNAGGTVERIGSPLLEVPALRGEFRG